MKAAIYPPNLCRAICRGIMKEKKRRQGELMPLMRLSAVAPTEKIPNKEEFHEKVDALEKEGVRGWLSVVLGEKGAEQAWDDLTGLELNAQKVKQARLKELEYIRDRPVWKKITRKEAMRNGWKVVKARWIDINKGDDEQPLIRSRYVGKEYNDSEMEGLLAGTPPLEAMNH